MSYSKPRISPHISEEIRVNIATFTPCKYDERPGHISSSDLRKFPATNRTDLLFPPHNNKIYYKIYRRCEKSVPGRN